MRYIFLVLLSLFILSCSDSPIQVIDNKQVLEDVLNEKLLGSVEAINTTIAVVIGLFATMLVVISMGFYNVYRQKKEIMQEVEDRTALLIEKKFKEQSEEIYDEITKKITYVIKKMSKIQRIESQKEEFIRNLIFYDLNKMRSTEQNDKDNFEKAFSDYADRFYIVSQLTSGIDKERSKALRKLATGSYRKIVKLKSFKNYITYLKESDIDLDTLAKIADLELKLVS